ncbi:hypothetical protein Tco_0918604 [Tanacetum coccineum]
MSPGIVFSTLHFLKILENSLEVVMVLKNSLEVLKVVQMEFQENSSIDEVGSDSKYSDMFKEFESGGASGSGGCGDDEESGDDEDGDGDD